MAEVDHLVIGQANTASNPGNETRLIVSSGMSQEYVMFETSLDDLLLQNPNAPTNDEYALHFARQLYAPREERDEERLLLGFAEGRREFEASDDEQVEWCGEASRGLLDAVLASNLLSSEARSEINAMMEDAAPSLERTKTIGHFRFQWTETSSDARDNTNETNVDATAAVLNDCWNHYVTDFRQPQADLIGGQRILDVEVYFDPSLHGSTSSHTNRIFLNSETVVNDDCRRQTTSAHELFHRVEYTYGYVTGTPGQRWWVEALGSWSQEYYAPAIDDYISRVNGGLANPSLGLFLTVAMMPATTGSTSASSSLSEVQRSVPRGEPFGRYWTSTRRTASMPRRPVAALPRTGSRGPSTSSSRIGPRRTTSRTLSALARTTTTPRTKPSRRVVDAPMAPTATWLRIPTRPLPATRSPGARER